MQLYNVLTRRLDPLAPVDNRITLYVCGITPYDTTHLGHGFTYATFDVLIRYLESQGHTVRYVQNVTDIDDDILRKAREVEGDWLDVGNRWTTHFIDDNVDLNIRPPEYYPRATDVIAEIIQAVQDLLGRGVAYEAAGNVYFEIAKDPDFGKLSRMSRPDMLPVANERGNKPDDPHKRDPLDFVLWQAQAPGEPAWDSPWGPGRPGWHIECSTMALKYLGQPIDIHGGGADLVFPHHESEIAQAECATGREPFSRFWMHVAMVHFEGEKMSKSLGNLVMVRDLRAAGWTADALRLYLASHHYRDSWSYEEDDLRAAAEVAARMAAASAVASGDGVALDANPYRQTFTMAMDNDLDTPAAVRLLERLAAEILEAAAAGADVAAAQAWLPEAAGILGLRLGDAPVEDRLIAGWARHRARFA
jgi:L-cysteine:1D-myo-inositol 2-amino-2-deoxy-alpha-D-glucopyranoside ligase